MSDTTIERAGAVTKLLVANRGEIAVRLIRGAHAVGCAAVAVYSEADADAPHVALADEAVPIGPAPAGQSYLSIERLIEAAAASGADAVHPGYGFLAENAEFARAVAAAGLVFVGPSAAAIELMGAKRAAKARMIEAGVPCVPGYQGTDQSDDTLTRQGERIGFPLMVKASAGGGGRGMRRVEERAGLAEAIRSARSEAESAFGSGELILEKAVTGARHVEIQVLADHHGHAIHLGERDCSVQRRHQKVVEEAPSPAVDAELRAKIGQAAVDAATAIDYRGAGTVEFLLAPDGAFYFMEMNTRLQVEHPVTEMITGLDLVAWQLRIAAGEPLTRPQNDLCCHGHAMEVRLCLEDVAQDFMPQTGPIHVWRAPTGPGIRVDHGLADGLTISPHYDSMAAKLIAWGQTRDIARRRLIGALDDTLLFGPTSNRDFLRQILTHDVFAGGDFDIGFVGAHMADAMTHAPPPALHRALAAAALYHEGAANLAASAGLDVSLIGWHSSPTSDVPVHLEHAAEIVHAIRIARDTAGRYRVQVDGQTIDLTLGRMTGTRLDYQWAGVWRRADFLRRGTRLWLSADGFTAAYGDILRQPPDAAGTAGNGRIAARMDGKIQRVDIGPGQHVTAGDTLLVLEAMKMEFSITTDIDGVVGNIGCTAGDQVAARELLVTITPD